MGHPVYLIKKRIYILYVDAFDTKGMSRKIFFDAIYKNHLKSQAMKSHRNPLIHIALVSIPSTNFRG